MKKTLIAGVVFMLTGLFRLDAQNLNYTSWKAYYGDPINDTIVFHVLKDTSFVTGKFGDTLVISHIRIVGDTLTLSDIGGMYQCPESDGTYTFKVEGDNLHFGLVNDGCDGRTAIKDIVWARVPQDKNKKARRK